MSHQTSPQSQCAGEIPRITVQPPSDDDEGSPGEITTDVENAAKIDEFPGWECPKVPIGASVHPTARDQRPYDVKQSLNEAKSLRDEVQSSPWKDAVKSALRKVKPNYVGSR